MSEGRFWPKFIRIVTLFAAAALYLHPQAIAQETTPPARSLQSPDSRFGAVETMHAPELADAVGVGWTRIILYWSELKKDGPDSWNEFHAPLDMIDREIAGGREVVGLLQHTPDFATDGVPGAGIPRGLYLPVDSPQNLWAEFVREVVKAYDGRISRWIIWNEPDIEINTYGAQWEGNPADYYRLVKVAYLAAKNINPDVKIHLGGITYWHNPGFMGEFLTAAASDPEAADNGFFFDVVSLHIYFKPESTIQVLSDIRQALSQYGLEDKPVWINETNAPPYDDPSQPWVEPPFSVTQQEQASFLLQEFALALALDVQRIQVYKWIDIPEPLPGFEPYGLLRSDRTTRPAYDAFSTIIRYYSGTTQAKMIEHPLFWEIILLRGDHVTRVYWARMDQVVTVQVPALSNRALLIDKLGSETSLSPQGGSYLLELPETGCIPDECLMGGEPLILDEEASPAAFSRGAHAAFAVRSPLFGPVAPVRAADGQPASPVQVPVIITVLLLLIAAGSLFFGEHRFRGN